MEAEENCLSQIGFAGLEAEAEYWNVSRSEAEPARQRSRSGSGSRDPARSRALQLWLARLSDRGRPAVYRISRAS